MYLCADMRKILFIVNPISGGKKKDGSLGPIRQRMDEGRLEGEIRLTTGPGDAEKWAREADVDVVAAVGGDGTVSEVGRGLIGSRKALGIIPCGSGDGLALHLGISRTVSKALDVLSDGVVTAIDYAEVDGQPFFCTIGVGLDALVAQKFAASPRRGVETYIEEAWRTWHHFRPETYRIRVDGQEQVFPAVFVTVGNVNQWGNEARITSLASVTDGLLDVAVVHPFHTVEIPLLATQLMDGHAHRSHRVTMLRGRRVSIIREAAGPAHVDGDPVDMGAEINAEIVPGGLRAVVPTKNRL